jgi:hypothetical protein
MRVKPCSFGAPFGLRGIDTHSPLPIIPAGVGQKQKQRQKLIRACGADACKPMAKPRFFDKNVLPVERKAD